MTLLRHYAPLYVLVSRITSSHQYS